MAWLDTTQFKKEEEVKPKAIFCVDFDDTIVEGAFPSIGPANPGAVEVLRELLDKGYRLILYTMRTDDLLNQALVYCNTNNIHFWAVNDNPEQEKWAPNSRKIFSHVVIDNNGLGTPLKVGGNGKPCVDWVKLREILVQWEVLPQLEESDGTKTFEIK